MHHLKPSCSEDESATASKEFMQSEHHDVKSPVGASGFALPNAEPFQPGESELESDVTLTKKISNNIYRTSWSHSPTIPNQTFIKRDNSKHDLHKYSGHHHYQPGMLSTAESGSASASSSCHAKLTRNAPFYDFVMSHINPKTPVQQQSTQQSSSARPVFVPTYRPLVSTLQQFSKPIPSALTILQRLSNEAWMTAPSNHSVELIDGYETQTITVTAHISTSSLHDMQAEHARPVQTNTSTRPAMSNVRTQMINTSPKMNTIRPQMNNIRPLKSNSIAPMNKIKPSMNNTRPSMSNTMPFMNNTRPSVSNTRLSVSNTRLSMSNNSSPMINIRPPIRPPMIEANPPMSNRRSLTNMRIYSSAVSAAGLYDSGLYGSDSEVMDIKLWKVFQMRRNKANIARLSRRVMSWLLFIFLWIVLLVASIVNSFSSGMCWEEEPEPEPNFYEWLTTYLFHQFKWLADG